MVDVRNEPSLHFSGSIALSNESIFPRPSSTQALNSHSNLNTHGQVGANINLPVYEPQEPSSRTNVTNNAHDMVQKSSCKSSNILNLRLRNHQ